MNHNAQTEEKLSVVMTEIMAPEMANFHGNVHGGHILKLLDRVAYVCASRYSGKYIVTLSVDQVIFKEPIHVGELVLFYASVNFVGTTSMEIGIKVIAENLFTGQRRHTNTSYFTMVGLDERGKPTKIPPLSLQNELQKRRHEEAIIRKEARLKIKNRQAKK